MIPPSTTSSITGLVWDEATESQALGLARRFEIAWDASAPSRRPDPRDFFEPGEPGGSGTLLAILRVDLARRRSVGEDARPERYRERYPDLSGEALVALVYEDYCLREEADELPTRLEYESRFPELADQLREILEIHELVAEPGSTRPDGESQAVPFPEAGQTIAGFFLVEELGRGSFARVFLARERQLADRSVALKVSRTGSREPQTLARLQHTHIVPVHSYRIDPATGLHLLCMPYFGRVTLARLLGEPDFGTTGAGLLAPLDRLGPPGSAIGGGPARSALSRLSRSRAVAWWGARLAEGLQHAHDRGVLHRDVKPSNVLLAWDGMPMLLDFNLAQEPVGDGATPSKLGGTLAYMAPEHLGAIADGHDGGSDHRADLYSLGMVLFEALGSKPLGASWSAPTDRDSLTRLLDERSRQAPRLLDDSAAIPPALDAVVRRCLAPDPDHRYQTAADLALDLQAVADDSPLTFAREPWRPRVSRWLRRHRSRLAIVVTVLLAVGASVALLVRSEAESVRRESDARALIRDGERSGLRGEPEAAAAQFSRALALLKGRHNLEPIRLEAARGREAADAARVVRDRATTFFEEAEPLRFALLGFVGDRAGASRRLLIALRPFGVLESRSWADSPDLARLDDARRARLLREVDDLLFFWVVRAAMDRAESAVEAPLATKYCDLALRFTDRRGSWEALRAWWDGSRNRGALIPEPSSGSEPTAADWFRWSLLDRMAGDSGQALDRLERAARLDPGNYWHQYALGFEWSESRTPARAIGPLDAAIALRPDSPWARRTRAKVRASLGEWSSAVDDLTEALGKCRPLDDATTVRLDRGMIRHRLGDVGGASADYQAAIEATPKGEPARAGRRNLARLAADTGATRAALTLYDALLVEEPGDSIARRGRIRLLSRSGRAAEAEADLDLLIELTPGSSAGPLLAERALVRLLRNRPVEAEADANRAFVLDQSPHNARICDRARLATTKALDPWPDRPDAFETWPDPGPPLRADLLGAAGRLSNNTSMRKTRAVLLSAAREHASALAEADRLVSEEPRSIEFRRLRAQIRHRAGLSRGALEDVTVALIEAPEDSSMIELRGRIRVDRGDFQAGLVDLQVAADRGSDLAVGPAMAGALLALGRGKEAAEVWSRVIEDDPLDPSAHLGQARAWRSIGEWDRAIVALERASSLALDDSTVLPEVVRVYASCLVARPERWVRVASLGWRIGLGRLGVR